MYDPSLEGTFRAVEVPGDEIMAAYCELVKVARAKEDAFFADTQDKDSYREYCVATAKCEGFREAVNFYCPDVPGYFGLHGHMIMAADIALGQQPAAEEPTCQ